MSLQDKGQLRPLARVQPSNLTQCSWKCLILILEERMQITLSVLAGDQQFWEELVVLL